MDKGVKTHMWTELNRFVMTLVSRIQLQREEGQALVEYTLILALVSIVAIAVLETIGAGILTSLGEVAGAL
jgi:Flp pilus assembly pilin Flp